MAESNSASVIASGAVESGDAGPTAQNGEPQVRPVSPFVDRMGGCVREHLLVIFLVCGLIMGIGIGALVRNVDPDFTDGRRNAIYLGYLGELFLRMLKGCIIPLVVASLIAGMASLQGKAAGRIIGMTFAYYMSTMYIAVIIGIVLVSSIRPGSGSENRDIDSSSVPDEIETADALLNLGRRLFPDNVVTATFQQPSTDYEEVCDENNKCVTKIKSATKNSTNFMGIVVFSIVLGMVLAFMGDEGLPVREFFESLQIAIQNIVTLVIWLSPIGVASILAKQIVLMDDIATAARQLGLYCATVVIGLAIHFFIVLPLFCLFFAKRNPFVFMKHMADAILTAFGTASSSATLPITMRCIELKAGVDHRISKFVLPVGATVNLDGTALYEAVAAIYIAQVNDYNLSFVDIFTISITATMAAVGAAGVPQAGLVTMVIVLQAVGLPVDQIGLILSVDWFLDRFRTACNVWGDAVGGAIIEHRSRDILGKTSSAILPTRLSQTEAQPLPVADEKPVAAEEPVDSGGMAEP